MKQKILIALYHVKAFLVEVKRNPRLLLALPWRFVKWCAWHVTGGIVIAFCAFAMLCQLPLYLLIRCYERCFPRSAS